jgi:hypothetical protein
MPMTIWDWLLLLGAVVVFLVAIWWIAGNAGAH